VKGEKSEAVDSLWRSLAGDHLVEILILVVHMGEPESSKVLLHATRAEIL
jgi:hypothetical protein